MKGANSRFWSSGAARLALACAALTAGTAWAADWEGGEGASLHAVYRAVAGRLNDPIADIPLCLESDIQADRVHAEIYAIADIPHEALVETLRHAPNLCEIAALHLNVKACTYEARDDATRLTIYSGRKFYQAPERGYRVAYDYRVSASEPDYFQAVFRDVGVSDDASLPAVLESVPVGGERVFVRFSYTYRHSLWSRVAADGYFATLGRHKVGFSQNGTARGGNPAYVGGMDGAIERNAARYLFALQAFIDTRTLPPRQRFDERLGRWFDMTERYRAQLHEIDKDVYLDAKRREWIEQARLQRAVDREHPRGPGTE